MTLTGKEARILLHVASTGWKPPPPDEVVTARERTPREYLAVRRAWWFVIAGIVAVGLASAYMLAQQQPGATPSEAELAAQWFGVSGAILLVAFVLWKAYRAAKTIEFGPLDVPGPTFRAEPDALVVEAPNAAPRRLAYAHVRRCDVDGWRAKQGWMLTALTLDDGAGPLHLRPEWLTSERLLHALAARLLASGSVAATP